MKKHADPITEDMATPTPMTSFILGGLERVEWEMERIDLKLRTEALRHDDRDAIARAFRKIARECEVLRKWLRAAPLEETRN